MKTTLKIALFAFTLCVAGAASADDSVRLEDHESKGYFDKVGRLGGYVGMLSGDRPVTQSTPGVPGSTTTAQKYTQTAVALDFDVLGFWDATRFDTLIGAELITKIGGYTGAKGDGISAEETDKNVLFFRMDAAADYGLLHWDGAIKGRISGGAGFGFDLNGSRWWTQSGRAYPLLLARLQLATGGLSGHASYHYIPTTTNDSFVREHRFEGALGIGALHAGLRLTLTPARLTDTSDWYVSRELGAFIAYAF